MRPWTFRDDQGRLDLTLTPIFDRAESTQLLVLASEVHQVFGRYDGTVIADDGERIAVSGVMGWAEEHCARW